MKISVIIPCFNERKTINTILDKLKNLSNFDKEIIIVDDFSNDGTKEVLKNLPNKEKIQIFFHDNNLGTGAAIHTALGYINGDINIRAIRVMIISSCSSCSSSLVFVILVFVIFIFLLGINHSNKWARSQIC